MKTMSQMAKLFYNYTNNELFVIDDKSNLTNSEKKEIVKKKIAIFGASGGTGKQLVKDALKRNHKVVAVVRNPSLLEEFKDKIEIRKFNVSDQTSIEDGIRGCDVVMSALGSGGISDARKPTTLYSSSAKGIIEAMKKLNIKKCMFITSVGVEYDDYAPCYYRNIIRPLFLMNSYMDMMKLETIVELLGSDLDWTLVRAPYLIDNDRARKFFVKDRKVNESAGFKISRSDLARFMIHEVENNLWIQKYPIPTYA